MIVFFFNFDWLIYDQGTLFRHSYVHSTTLSLSLNLYFSYSFRDNLINLSCVWFRPYPEDFVQ